MRIRLPLWMLMALIAAVALGLASRARSDHFRRLAESYNSLNMAVTFPSNSVAQPGADAPLLENVPDVLRPQRFDMRPDLREFNRAITKKIVDHRQMLRRKYLAAAAWPLLPVVPDPPLPDLGPGVDVRFFDSPSP